MKEEKIETRYCGYLYVGIVCMILLVIACFLPGIEDSKYTTIGDTWGFEYYKDITFIRFNLKIRSFVMFFWLGLLIVGIYQCVKGRAERDSQMAIVFVTAILGLVLLVRTYDYASNPSKLVFGHSNIMSVKDSNTHTFQIPSTTKEKEHNFYTQVDSLKDAGTFSTKGTERNIVGSVPTIRETSFLGIKAKEITYNRTFPLGVGFWFMLVVVLFQLLIAFKLWNIDSQTKVIDSLEKE